MSQGNTVNGIFNIHKPQNMTSHDVVALVRKKLGIKRVGHTGTLDPMATGVLPVCVGAATRIMEYLDPDLKTYRCKMQLGLKTDTEDIWGSVTEHKDASFVNEEDIRKAFAKRKGLISQIPPKYSALKVNGKKLYEYAREDRPVEIKPREIYIDSLTVEHIDLELSQITYTVTCSKGTYIRSICRDIGEDLGCGAVMSGLVRTQSGVFSVEKAMDTEALINSEKEDVLKHLLPVDYPLVHFGKAIVHEKRVKWFTNGGKLRGKEVEIEREPVLKHREAHIPVKKEYQDAYNMYDGDRFLGVALYNEVRDEFTADKIFYK